jgi:hypothetical protein
MTAFQLLSRVVVVVVVVWCSVVCVCLCGVVVRFGTFYTNASSSS